jgi:hypothetical protein
VHNRRSEGAAKRALGRDRVRCRRRDCPRARRCRCRSRRSLFTMSNSAVFFIPVARFCAGFSFLFVPTPERGVGGAPKGALGSPVALARRDTALARRGPSRATGTAPLGAPPWRFSAEGPGVMCPTVPPDHAATSRAPAARPKAFGSRSLPAAVAPQSRDATPRSASERLRRRPS